LLVDISPQVFHLGDTLDLLAGMLDDGAQLMITSPPYNIA
jgi:hypothetical protein